MHTSLPPHRGKSSFQTKSHAGTHRPNNLAPTIFGLAGIVLKLESAEECRHRKPIKMNNLTEEVQVPSDQIATNDQRCQFGSTAERQTYVITVAICLFYNPFCVAKN